VKDESYESERVEQLEFERPLNLELDIPDLKDVRAQSEKWWHQRTEVSVHHDVAQQIHEAARSVDQSESMYCVRWLYSNVVEASERRRAAVAAVTGCMSAIDDDGCVEQSVLVESTVSDRWPV
jgi:hypothetical protein